MKLSLPNSVIRLLIIWIAIGYTTSAFSQATEKPNIILIYFDDLNDYTGITGGHPQTSTPTIDMQANEGIVFQNAHCSAPGCAPSRTSMLSGKDCYYTGVVHNSDYASNFREVFSAATNNAEVYTLPEILKDSGNYFTYVINKAFHSKNENDFDKFAADDCSRELSWNKRSVFEEPIEFIYETLSYSEYAGYGWGIIPDSLESKLVDYRSTDTAIQFIHDYATGAIEVCDKEAFMMTIGYERPHTGRMIPEKYFLPYYLQNIYEAPLHSPINSAIYDDTLNGIIMPPQPEILYGDYFNFAPGSISKMYADYSSVEPEINEYLASLPFLPVVDDSLTSMENFEQLKQYQIANYVIAYLAAVKYLDAQISRVLEALQSHPELYSNTIIVITSDHGYSMGEKKHFTKWALWETDLRVPFIFWGPGIDGGKVSNKSVSILDFFPTILELAGVDAPASVWGGAYADGQSLVPLIENPTLQWSRPAIATTSRNHGETSCFYSYSVKTNRYHMIRYQYNNDGTMPGNICDSSSERYDYELYDVGEQREIDPNEWNNLGEDPEYEKLRTYLESFLPGQSHYLQKAYTARIGAVGSVSCYLNHGGKIKLKAGLTNPEGANIPTSGFQFTWSNSATPFVKIGNKYNFKLNTIPSDYYDTHDRIFFYLTVKNGAGDTVAFEQTYYYLNPVNSPEVSFDPTLTAMDLSIADLNISGSYSSSTWNFGDGHTSYLEQPFIHTYPGEGSYTLLHQLNYGNGCQLNTLHEMYIKEDSIFACTGDNILLPDGSVAETSGTYVSQLTSMSGEDSVIISYLNFGDTLYWTLYDSICPGDSVILPDGSVVWSAGTYDVLLPSLESCDTSYTIEISDCAPELIPRRTDPIDGITIYPIPASHQLFVSSKDAAIEQISLSTLDGQLVYLHFPADESFTQIVEVSGLAAGPYVMKLVTSGSTVTRQVVVVH